MILIGTVFQEVRVTRGGSELQVLPDLLLNPIPVPHARDWADDPQNIASAWEQLTGGLTAVSSHA